MTNQERIQARIARSKARKAEKRKPLIAECGDFRSVITNQNLLRSLQKRRKETEWKGSVQSYISHAIVKNKRAKDALLEGRMNVNQSIKHLVIHERGKRRDCHAIMIDSRVIQGAVCDSSITPLTQPSLIYDNPASTKGKGVEFARRRMNHHLRRQIAESGPDFYVLRQHPAQPLQRETPQGRTGRNARTLDDVLHQNVPSAGHLAHHGRRGAQPKI